MLLALAVLLALAGAVISGPLASAAASPRDGGCTDCARDLIGIAHDIGLNTLLARLGEQFVVVAGLLAVAWLAAQHGQGPASSVANAVLRSRGRCGGRYVRRGQSPRRGGAAAQRARRHAGLRLARGGRLRASRPLGGRGRACAARGPGPAHGGQGRGGRGG